MLKSVLRSEIFSEFTPEEQQEYFSVNEKAVSHHVDTLYYSVFIRDDVSYTDGKLAEETVARNVQDMLSDLHSRKEKKRLDLGETVYWDDEQELEISPFGVAIGGGLYANHLLCPENYDIFVSDYIPNDDTPRIHVQLRTRSLVLDGLYGSIERSFRAVKKILNKYDLKVASVQENRIDYAFHTNIIQRPMEMFGDESLNAHLVTQFWEYQKHCYIRARHADFLDLDYLALGSRKSNNLFFRAYEKSKEVIQQNYKAFFFEIWRERGLISRYDQYVYETAYSMKSFRTGCLVGRINWYLEYGKNPERKAYLRDLLEKCNVKSENNLYIEKQIKGVLPPPTVILNIEFETKRKFYLGLSECLDSQPYEQKQGSLELRRLYSVLGLRRKILRDLMTNTVCFTENRRDVDAEVMHWWDRIRNTRIEGEPEEDRREVWRTYSRKMDLNRTKKRLCGSLATYTILDRNETAPCDIGGDIWDLISALNDNDKDGSQMPDEMRVYLAAMSSSEYRTVRAKKARQLKSMLKEKTKK